MAPTIPSTEETFIEWGGHRIPFMIIKERRRSIRVAFGNKKITLRLPLILSAETKSRHIEKSKNWAIDQLKIKPGLIQQFMVKTYSHGQWIFIYGRKYLLSLNYHDKKLNKAQVKGQLLELHLSTELQEHQKPEIIRYLLSRAIANDCYESMASRVKTLNEQHFNQPIRDIRLKLNQSNWGSCSSKNNINLSARLLFAPQEVIDYVIIHELAHLIEHNHSARYWTLVEKAMPEYKKYEAWLSTNSHLCEF
jgi:predicted metal-dependent hydrolase